MCTQLQESEKVAPLMTENSQLKAENTTLIELLKWQAEQAAATESLLFEQWAAWERRARILEQIEWDSGAWEWVARRVARGDFRGTCTQPLLLNMPRTEVVEVISYHPHPTPTHPTPPHPTPPQPNPPNPTLKQKHRFRNCLLHHPKTSYISARSMADTS